MFKNKLLEFLFKDMEELKGTPKEKCLVIRFHGNMKEKVFGRRHKDKQNEC